jgi:hypothetical protein
MRIAAAQPAWNWESFIHEPRRGPAESTGDRPNIIRLQPRVQIIVPPPGHQSPGMQRHPGGSSAGEEYRAHKQPCALPS